MREIKTTDYGGVRMLGSTEALSAEIFRCNRRRRVDASDGLDFFEISRHEIELPEARALIAAWDRERGNLPELPPGYKVQQLDDGWTIDCPDGAMLWYRERVEALTACWQFFVTGLEDPKWVQLLRGSGLPVCAEYIESIGGASDRIDKKMG